MECSKQFTLHVSKGRNHELPGYQCYRLVQIRSGSASSRAFFVRKRKICGRNRSSPSVVQRFHHRVPVLCLAIASR
ncbi:hypothetical protein E2C01_076258 [Portunus trituberculatus]|uniref:Uncharacterized protein n=1 Tax=Portunus trituberculatus TaxID=210409 RepID=A0A5B7IB02_PORTR|nr:hypothetical protein [Portunus trituberculatus]